MKKQIISGLLSAALCVSVLVAQGEVCETTNSSNIRKVYNDSRFIVSSQSDNEDENPSVDITPYGRDRDIRIIVITERELLD